MFLRQGAPFSNKREKRERGFGYTPAVFLANMALEPLVLISHIPSHRETAEYRPRADQADLGGVFPTARGLQIKSSIFPLRNCLPRKYRIWGVVVQYPLI